MRLEAGTTAALTVARERPPHGYVLTNGSEDVLLPYAETTRPVQVGERLNVFLFHDSDDRPAATMKTPHLALNEVGLLTVEDVHRRLGCFLDIGIGKHVLLPASELPEDPSLRPQVGDRVYVRLDRDKAGRLLARAAREEDLRPITVRAPYDWKNRTVDAIVYKTLRMGSFVVCDAGVLGFGVLGFIHASERTEPLRVGRKLAARVVYVREDGRVNLSLRKAKEIGRIEDADRILAYLRSRPNGAMPYSDKTPADLIAAKFNISKSAFKRALGKLMKDGLIVQKENWTYLSETVPNSPNGARASGRPSERDEEQER
jgi:hypothetical protein